MAGNSKRKANKKSPFELWWARLVAALAAIGLSYGFASWAIDTGSLLQYAVSILLLYFGVATVFRVVRTALAK